ncbi:MAG: right-handed parallel beta-helix repeat-containing protein [Clostridia bacterium]|nr:right-handed parallel beta-helix repeat-containing protein [Clostridia bacterium]
MKVIVKNTAELEKYILDSDGSELEITLLPGIYTLENTLEIKNKKNIKIVGEDGARLVGGKKLDKVSLVTDEEILSHLDPSVKNRIYMVDLRENGISDDLSICCADPIGFSVNGTVMHLSQYPKKSKYITITDYINFVEPEIDDGWGRKEGLIKDGVVFNDPHVRNWKDPKNLWTNGFWIYDWMTGRYKVTDLDPDKMIVKLDGDDNEYFRIGQRMFFYNILEELNEPGTFYIDEVNRTIYFVSPDGGPVSDVILATLNSSAMHMVDCENITLENINVESTMGRGIYVCGGRNISILYCEVKNMYDTAVELDKVYDAVVRGCSVHDCAGAGISIDSGDVQSLIPGNSLACDNHIYRMAHSALCYAGGLNLCGVGNTARNNLIHDHPHTAIFFMGNDLLIEHNEMYNLIQDTGDSGAIYAGRDYTARGNIIRENFVHHLGGVGIGAMGVYNDDCFSGTIMERNIFLATPRACMLGGGRELKVNENIFISCHPAIELDSRGEPDMILWRNIMNDLSKAVNRRLRVNPKFVEKYPELQEILDFFNAEECLPHIHPSAKVTNNIFCDSSNFIFNMGGISAELELDNNSEIEYSEFKDANIGDFDVTNALALRRGFKGIDMSKIGISDPKCRSGKLADLYSAFIPTPDKLIFKVINRGDRTETVSYSFDSNVPNYDLTEYNFTATVKAGEIYTLEMPMSPDLYEQVPNGKYDLHRINGLYKVRAYCPTPGARPAEFISKKEIFKFGANS